MNHKHERQRVSNHNCAGSQAAALSTALVVERLRLEAMLATRQLVMHVSGNVILLPFPGFAAVVAVNQRQDAGFTVQIQACLGEALFADEARRILESGIVNVGEQQAEVAETGLVTVRWDGTYAGQVDVAAVHAALRQNLQIAFNLQQALTEDCYLKPSELPETFIQKGRP